MFLLLYLLMLIFFLLPILLGTFNFDWDDIKGHSLALIGITSMVIV